MERFTPTSARHRGRCRSAIYHMRNSEEIVSTSQNPPVVIRKANLKKRMFGRVSQIPTPNTLSLLVEMDFVDYGDYAAFLQIQGNFSRLPVAVFIGTKKKGEQTSEMARETTISHGLAASGAPDILIVYNDMGYWVVLPRSPPSRNIALLTFIPGHRRSLGAAGRRLGHYRAIADHIVGDRKANCLERDGGGVQQRQRCVWAPKYNSLAGLSRGNL